jgi:threonine synthase
VNYQSTRDSCIQVSSAQAMVRGISCDGGLFVPEELPCLSHNDLLRLRNCSYAERASRILSLFLDDFTKEEIDECTALAYNGGKFENNLPAPISSLQNGKNKIFMLELWHGPTCAFKDMALQLLPHLLTKSLNKVNAAKTAVILVATSGDTGKAALEGFKDVPGTRIQVFYPENGVSPMQKSQMNTQEGNNVAVCAIKGNFDDAQTGVKNIFADENLNRLFAEHNMMLSSANSINWGRLLPQIVYYFSAYADLLESGNIRSDGEKVNIAVPTGNFGNILAAYYAKKMGLPVHKLICASNENNVLTEFLNTGIYNRNRKFFTTISPSMDILVSSNLERLLFDITGGDSNRIRHWMDALAETGTYQVEEDVLQQLREIFYAGYSNDHETRDTIKQRYDSENYLCDTHTAVAVKVYQQYAKDTQDILTPTIIVSTASPYKFADSVLGAISKNDDRNETEYAKLRRLSALTGLPIPEQISQLEQKPIRFKNTCEKNEMAKISLQLIDRE